MAEINFNGNFNNNINNAGIAKKDISKKTEINISNATDFKPSFGNTMSIDTLELSIKKDEDTEAIRYNSKANGKGKGRGKTWSQINKEEWDRRGGVENYNGKGADEMGFSVFVSTTVRWVWNKIFG